MSTKTCVTGNNLVLHKVQHCTKIATSQLKFPQTQFQIIFITVGQWELFLLVVRSPCFSDHIFKIAGLLLIVRSCYLIFQGVTKLYVLVYHIFMQTPVHPPFGRVNPVVDVWVNGWKYEGAKQVFQNHRYCQLCLRSECKMVSHVCL